MSTVELKLDAEKRTDLGKGASRRLRRAKKIPAIIYGGGKDPVALTLAEQQVLRLLEEEGFYSQILDVNIGGKTEKAILKDMQRHAYKPLVEHIDLQRVVKGQKMRGHVPLHFMNQETSKGAKAGGVIHHDMIELEIECLPKDLPEYIEVDIQNLEAGASLHLSEVKLPKGVSIPALAQGPEHDLPVVSIRAPKVSGESESASGEEGEEAGEE